MQFKCVTAYLVEDRNFPLIDGTAIIRTGSRFEPANKVDLAQLTGSVMRSGGTENHPSAELNSILEQKVASIETNIGNSSGSASFRTLTKDLNTVFSLFAEVLPQPAFAADKFAIASVVVMKTRESLDLCRDVFRNVPTQLHRSQNRSLTKSLHRQNHQQDYFQSRQHH